MTDYIKREDVLQIFSEDIDYYGKYARQAINEIPSAETSEDCIGRASAKERIVWLLYDIEEKHDIVVVDVPSGYACIADYVDDLLDDCKSVLPIRPSGEWVQQRKNFGGHIIETT